MRLTDDESRAALYVTSETVRRRQLTGVPIPAWLRALHRTLSSSVHGPGSEAAQAGSAPELIDTRSAAEILGVSERYTRRIATDLDGTQIAGRWCFNRATVTDYAPARKERP